MGTVYPHWVCQECGTKAFKGRQFKVSCWHVGTCDICGKERNVTEFRDFFYGNPSKEVDKQVETCYNKIEKETIC